MRVKTVTTTAATIALWAAASSAWAQEESSDAMTASDGMEPASEAMAEEGAAMGAEGEGPAGMGMAEDGGAMSEGGMEMTAEGEGMMGGMEGMEQPDPLHVFFESGSARIGPDQQGVLDDAVRTFRDGDWVVIEVSGVADTVGPPDANLELSLRRAQSVLAELVDRGVDPLQLQLRARGNSELAVPTGDGVAERGNRVAEITWR